jgi:hypothetical protein
MPSFGRLEVGFDCNFAGETLSSDLQETVDLLYQFEEALGVLFNSRSGAQSDPTLLSRGLLVRHGGATRNDWRVRVSDGCGHVSEMRRRAQGLVR